jgi:hypothetical protein
MANHLILTGPLAVAQPLPACQETDELMAPIPEAIKFLKWILKVRLKVEAINIYMI